MTPPFSPPALPPSTAEYLHTVQPATAGAAPQQLTSSVFRSSDGKTRVDTGNMSQITNPGAGQTILLNHAMKQAHVIPAPPAAPPLPGQPPAMPGMPSFAPPAVPSAPQLNVKDLGKSVMNGHEVEGKQFTYSPPALPAMPGAPGMPKMPGAPAMPKIPGAPAVPGMPSAPAAPGMPSAGAMPQIPGMPAVLGMPAAPAAPGKPAAPAVPGAPVPPVPPTVAEVWTSTKMRIPMLTKMNGPFGQSSSVCQNAIPGEPHPSMFQIPAGYKIV